MTLALVYSLGQLIPIIGFLALLIIIIYLIAQRIQEKEEETFEDRDS